MTKRQRLALWMFAVFLLCAALIFVTAYSLGADPFHPRSRHIWALSLVAAAYVSFRLVTIVSRIAENREDYGASGWWAGFAKKEHAIDKRMAARRERVEAAKARVDEMKTDKKDNGDD